MDGRRIQEYFFNESKALIDVYKQFQVLLPDGHQDAASHKGEDGRYVESLLKEFLKRFLPKDLEILTGFIMRPAVKTGLNNRDRKGQVDSHSTQLDIIVYDSNHYPIFQRFGDNAIVPPEGVISIISVKKKFNDYDFPGEIIKLKEAAKICSYTTESDIKIRGPFLAMVAMDSMTKKEPPIEEWIFSKINEAYGKEQITFDEAVGLITNIEGWSIFKRRPTGNQENKAKYLFFKHSDKEGHLSLQFLLTGILSVYYDETRNFRERPGFTGFPSRRNQDKFLGEIEVSSLR